MDWWVWLAEDGREELGAVVGEHDLEEELEGGFALRDAFDDLAAKREALEDGDGDAHL